MCFQFIEVRIFGQVKTEVFGTAESVQISKYRIAFYFTRVLYTQVVGIGIHTFHFFLYFVGRVGEVDAVSQALTHLGFSICSGQAQAGGVVGQKDFRFNQCFTINIVEAANDFACLFQHWFLVFAHRDSCCLESGNVRSLADGVGEETYRDAGVEVAQLNFCLYCRITLQAAYGHHIHEVKTQFAQFGNLRLNEDGAFCRVQPACQIVKRHFDNILTYLFRVVHIVRQCLCIGYENKYLVIQTGVLQLHSSSQ